MKNKEDFVVLKSLLIVFPFFVISILFVGGTMLHWFDKVEAPANIIATVDWEIENSDFYKTEEKNGETIITFSDKVYSPSNDSHLTDNTGSIHFEVTNLLARKDYAKLKWTIDITSPSNRQNTYERDTIPAGNEFHFFDKDFNLELGKNIVTVHAKNKAGEISKTFIINKLSTTEECDKAENKNVGVCKQVREAKENDKKKKSENSSSSTKSNNKSNLNSGTSLKKDSCVHYEYGKCWDELEDRAYEDGYRDAMNGSHSYYDPDCTGHCEDIYEDAYYDGFDDGQHGV